MTKRVVYLDPGDTVEVRVCDPVHGERACAATWKLSTYPQALTLEVASAYAVHLWDTRVNAFYGRGDSAVQLLPRPRQPWTPI